MKILYSTPNISTVYRLSSRSLFCKVSVFSAKLSVLYQNLHNMRQVSMHSERLVCRNGHVPEVRGHQLGCQVGQVLKTKSLNMHITHHVTAVV